MAITDDLRKTFSDPTPLYFAAGTADLALQQAKKVPALVEQLRAEAPARIDAVRNTGMLCEAALCYTGDNLDPKRTKYNLAYYVDLAKQLEKRGANLLAIKDMAGLCKPYAAR